MTSRIHLTFNYTLQARDFEVYTVLTVQSYPNQTATAMLPNDMDASTQEPQKTSERRRHQRAIALQSYPITPKRKFRLPSELDEHLQAPPPEHWPVRVPFIPSQHRFGRQI